MDASSVSMSREVIEPSLGIIENNLTDIVKALQMIQKMAEEACEMTNHGDEALETIAEVNRKELDQFQKKIVGETYDTVKSNIKKLMDEQDKATDASALKAASRF